MSTALLKVTASFAADMPQPALALGGQEYKHVRTEMAPQSFDSSSLAEARQRLAGRMRHLRIAAHMRQGAAAARAGIDRTTWNRIELAKMADIRLETLLRIEYALGVDTLEALFGETTGDLFRRRGESEDAARRRAV